MGPPDPEQRFGAVYMAHYPAVLSYVRRRTDSPDDAADAIAETFTTVWRRERVAVSRPSDALAARAAAAGTFTTLLLGLGAVALLVGGIATPW
jgi:hypothetical protein